MPSKQIETRSGSAIGRWWRRAREQLRRFNRDNTGAIAIIFVLTLVPIAAAAGAAVDISRAYLVKHRLGMALDAAGLAVGASSGATEEELNAIMQSYFDANYPAEELGVTAEPQMTIDGSDITITATADIDTTLMKIVGIDNIEVAASTTIIRETKGLDVVLVLDNTGSMSGSKLTSLKTAATSFVEILFGDNDESDLLLVGVVPFTGAVNIGIDEDFRDLYTTSNPVDADYEPDIWRGCVEARESPYDTTDDSQLDSPLGGGRWERYLWPDDYYRNRWSRLYESLSNWQSYGPNKYCPIELLPMTNVKQTVLDKIDDMIARGVTHINLGAVWGWRVLSPGAPYTAGHDYDDDEFNKAIVIMTDGANYVSSNEDDYSGFGLHFELIGDMS
ncbi:MAG: pilus assembly protein, partial [Alphaproteobacteria bacterium]|nr:pilus assembly protein [Alphaproteobacteria bacterium]